MDSNLYEKLILEKDKRIDSETSLRLLYKAFDKKNGGMVEVAMYRLSDPEGFTNKFSEIFCKLLQADWHYCHENIALILQGIKDPTTVNCLFEAAELHFDYLDYDDGFAFARKCTWALADIGTAEAK